MIKITSQNGSKPPLHSLASLPKENKSTSNVSKCYHLITNTTQYIHQHTSKSKNKYALKRPKPNIQASTACATDQDSSTDSSLFHILQNAHPKLPQFIRSCKTLLYTTFVLNGFASEVCKMV